MSLPVFQGVLLKLYTNKNFQEKFLINRQESLHNLNLSRREQKALLNLPEKELKLFSSELFHKRHDFITAVLERSQPNYVFCSSFYVSSPVIAFTKADAKTTVEISDGAYLILEHMAHRQIGLKSLIEAYLSSGAGAADFLNLVSALTRNGLMGKDVKLF